MKIAVHNRCSDFASYRAARVKSLFNAESGCNFDLEAELPIAADDGPGAADWKLGLVVGPSGSGKTSIGLRIFPELGAKAIYDPTDWPADKPIVDAIAPGAGGDFNEVTGALAAVGLGSVPAWLALQAKSARAEVGFRFCASGRAIGAGGQWIDRHEYELDLRKARLVADMLDPRHA